MSERRSRAASFIGSHQNPDGGWGYRPGGASLVEPTGLCALVLRARGDVAAASRGLAFLKTCLKPNGAVGVHAGDPDGSWMAYAALLAFRAFGTVPEERRLKDWILKYSDTSAHFTPDDLKAISGAYRYDASIQGWPWTPGTTGWVEPTALFMIALVRAETSPAHERIRSGVRLLLDRRVMAGGWNFGNPYANSFPLEATVLSTALALAALGAAGVPESRPAVGEGMRFLTRGLTGEVSTVSLAWTLLALNSYPAGAALAPAVAKRLAGLQEADGSFRGNLFETALASLVLDDISALLRVPERSE